MTRKIKEIRPNPVLTSTVEIRFSSALKQEEALSVFFKAFGQEYPKLTDKGIPKQLKVQDPNLRYSADYILTNNTHSISFSNNVIVFENIGGYSLWPNYFNEIKKNLSILRGLNIITDIKRIGVRYVSMFETSRNINELIRFNLLIGYPNFLQKSEFFRVALTNSNVQLNLQLAQNARVQIGEIVKNGLYVDIDASQEENLPASINEDLTRLIDELHTHEKGLFQYTLNLDFLNSLDVIYE